MIDNHLLRFLRREYRRSDLATQTLLTLGRDLLDTLLTHGYGKEGQELLRLALEDLEGTESVVRTEAEEAVMTVAHLKAARESADRAAKATIKLIEFAGLVDPTYAHLTEVALAARTAAVVSAPEDEDAVVEDGGEVEGAAESG